MAVNNLNYNENLEDFIVQRYLEGETTYSLAPVVGMSPSGVRAVLRRKGVARRPAVPKEKDLPWEEVIRKYMLGQSSHKLGRRYKVSPSTICKGLKKRGVHLRGPGSYYVRTHNY